MEDIKNQRFLRSLRDPKGSQREELIKPSLFFKLKRFIKECIRVLKVTKKPSNLEFKTIVKASALGMAIIGLIGFLIIIIKTLFSQM